MSNTNYNEVVKENFLNPKNMGEMQEPDGEGMIGNARCGDVLKIMIRVKEDKIEDIKFQTFGCAAAIASSSMLTQIAKGKNLDEAYQIDNKDVLERLGGLPNIKIHCSNLAADVLRKAIDDYKNKLKK
ncbi:MAG: iron-sulfur cluster assembly scaffold protein [Candidatus Pacearchaeota archaeon]